MSNFSFGQDIPVFHAKQKPGFRETTQIDPETGETGPTYRSTGWFKHGLSWDATRLQQALDNAVISADDHFDILYAESIEPERLKSLHSKVHGVAGGFKLLIPLLALGIGAYFIFT